MGPSHLDRSGATAERALDQPEGGWSVSLAPYRSSGTIDSGMLVTW